MPSKGRKRAKKQEKLLEKEEENTQGEDQDVSVPSADAEAPRATDSDVADEQSIDQAFAAATNYLTYIAECRLHVPPELMKYWGVLPYCPWNVYAFGRLIEYTMYPACGGILCDEPGLDSIMTILPLINMNNAFALQPDGWPVRQKPALIVVPSEILHMWEQAIELLKTVPLTYKLWKWVSGKYRLNDRDKINDPGHIIILTTYGTIAGGNAEFDKNMIGSMVLVEPLEAGHPSTALHRSIKNIGATQTLLVGSFLQALRIDELERLLSLLGMDVLFEDLVINPLKDKEFNPFEDKWDGKSPLEDKEFNPFEDQWDGKSEAWFRGSVKAFVQNVKSECNNPILQGKYIRKLSDLLWVGSSYSTLADGGHRYLNIRGIVRKYLKLGPSLTPERLQQFQEMVEDHQSKLKPEQLQEFKEMVNGTSNLDGEHFRALVCMSLWIGLGDTTIQWSDGDFKRLHQEKYNIVDFLDHMKGARKAIGFDWHPPKPHYDKANPPQIAWIYDQIQSAGIANQLVKDSPKLRMVRDYIQKHKPKEKVLIWALYPVEVLLITKFLRAAGVKEVMAYHKQLDTKERIELLDKFRNTDDVRVLVLSYEMARYPLNLQGCCRLALFVTDAESIPKTQRAISQLRAPGQPMRQIMLHLYQKDSYDRKFRDLIINDAFPHIVAMTELTHNWEWRKGNRARMLRNVHDWETGFSPVLYGFERDKVFRSVRIRNEWESLGRIMKGHAFLEDKRKPKRCPFFKKGVDFETGYPIDPGYPRYTIWVNGIPERAKFLFCPWREIPSLMSEELGSLGTL